MNGAGDIWEDRDRGLFIDRSGNTGQSECYLIRAFSCYIRTRQQSGVSDMIDISSSTPDGDEHVL
jgi:hypothetical protein